MLSMRSKHSLTLMGRGLYFPGYRAELVHSLVPLSMYSASTIVLRKKELHYYNYHHLASISQTVLRHFESFEDTLVTYET